jgi:hypothetical protein
MAFPIVPSARSSALTGIRSASDRLDAAAANIVRETTSWGKDSVSISPDARAAASSASSVGGVGGVAEAIVDTRLAKYQNAASVAVLRTADEMTEELVNLGKRR